MRAPAVALLTSTALLLVTGTAAAGTVGIDGDTLRYEAAPSEFNEEGVVPAGAEELVGGRVYGRATSSHVSSGSSASSFASLTASSSDGTESRTIPSPA